MIIRVSRLFKRFGKKTVLDRVSFGVVGGEIFGILGKNGAGKTVLINTMTGLIEAGGGEVKFRGTPVGKDLNNYRSQINLASSYQSLQMQESAQENLRTFAGLYGVRRERVDEVLELVGVKDKDLKKKKLYNLSSGEVSRVNLAKALLNRPRLLFLDEPTSFLDPIFKEELMNLLKKINREWGTTIIFSSHQLDEVRRLCTRVLVLRTGERSYLGKVKNIDLIKYY